MKAQEKLEHPIQAVRPPVPPPYWVEAYEKLRQGAEAAWRELEASLRIVVSIATCAESVGARGTLAALTEESARRGLGAQVGSGGCWGLCFAEPTALVAWPDGRRLLYGHLGADRVPRLAVALAQGEPCHELALGALAGEAAGVPPLGALPFWTVQERRLMANCGLIDPEKIDHYIARGGYEGLARALTLSPGEVIQQVLAAGLWGRGGAAFPAGRKWEFLSSAQASPRYLVCNADEGDPGAFVNRTLMEGDPHLIIEGLLIAGYATGASYGFIYIRDEYPLAAQRMATAIAQARQRGLLGPGVLGQGFAFDLEIVEGAGSYVCGEETGLIASVEGSRGMPKIRPPFPAQAGVLGKPTNVNNVETYANVPLILRHGADWYASAGSERNKGTKMFSLSGNIRRVGVLEVPLGTPLRRVILTAGGGPPEHHQLKAVQPGGPLGGIIPAAALDIPLEPESFRELGALLGSGGLVAVDDSSCIVDLCLYFAAFAEEESCGRCTTCRGGTQRMVEIFQRIAAGRGRPTDPDLLRLLGEALRNANCAHGTAAPTAALNALQHFQEELGEHIRERRCRARSCPGLIRYEIDPRAGEAGAQAAAICPTTAIREHIARYAIDDALCIRCDACREVAPGAVRVVDAFAPAAVSAP